MLTEDHGRKVETKRSYGIIGITPSATASTIARPGRSIVPDEPLPWAVHRISIGLLSRAIADLRPHEDSSFDEGVHSARKRMKRLRAMLRLVRDDVGYRTYREENVVLRDTARTMSSVRDGWVLVETLRRLRGTYADLLDEETFMTPDAWLLARREEQRRMVTRPILSHAICSLGTARSRFANFPIEEAITDDYGAIAGGIERVYRRGYRGLERAGATRAVEDLHEWRKRVKYLRYQMEALTPMYPALIGPAAKGLDKLGKLLGYDHDLAVLAKTVLEHPASCRDDRELWMLVALIHERRTTLQTQALRLGSALYVEEPSSFVDRIGAYWEAGRR